MPQVEDFCITLVRAGQDPSVERRRSKERGRSFEAVGREWLAKEQGQWTAHHRIATTSRMERLIFPRIGSLPMDSIEPPDMLALCNAIKDGVSVYMAHVILGICGRIFRYGVVCGYVTSDPCRDLKGALPSHKHKPMAALVNPKDIARLMKAIDIYDGDIKTRSALMLIPLCMVRTGELRQGNHPIFSSSSK